MANAKDIKADSANILVIGDSGTGKTTFLGTVPGIEVFDFDLGMVSLRGKDIDYFPYRDLPAKDGAGKPVKATKAQNEVGLYTWGQGWYEFVKGLNALGKRIEEGKGPKAVALDSLSFLSELAMNAVLDNFKIDTPDQRSYGAQQKYIKTVLGELTAWPVRLICTAHIKRDDNLVTGRVGEKLPLLTGQLAGFIGAFFDEVYYIDRGADGKYTLQTQPDPQIRQAKSRWGVPNKTPADFAQVAKFFGTKAA